MTKKSFVAEVTFDFILFVCTSHTDFAFNQFSISTECCFEILKKVEMVKFTPILFRFPTLNKKKPAKFSIPLTGGPTPSLITIEKPYMLYQK